MVLVLVILRRVGWIVVLRWCLSVPLCVGELVLALYYVGVLLCWDNGGSVVLFVVVHFRCGVGAVEWQMYGIQIFRVVGCVGLSFVVCIICRRIVTIYRTSTGVLADSG